MEESASDLLFIYSISIWFSLNWSKILLKFQNGSFPSRKDIALRYVLTIFGQNLNLTWLFMCERVTPWQKKLNEISSDVTVTQFYCFSPTFSPTLILNFYFISAIFFCKREVFCPKEFTKRYIIFRKNQTKDYL